MRLASRLADQPDPVLGEEESPGCAFTRSLPVSRYLYFAASLVLCLPALLQAQVVPINPAPFPADGTATRRCATGGVLRNDPSRCPTRRGHLGFQRKQSGVEGRHRAPVEVASWHEGAGHRQCRGQQPAIEHDRRTQRRLDNRSTIQGKVDSLTITSLTRDKQAGIFPDDSGLGGNDLDKPAKRSTHGGKGGRAQIVGHCRIVGRLVVNRGSGLSVQPGRGTPLRSSWATRPRSPSIWPI